MSNDATAQQKLKIAVLNRHFGHRFGGAERYSAAVVELMANQHEIHVFAQEIEHNFPGVTYHRISRPFAKPRWVNQLWFAFETWRQTKSGFDVVHSHENTWHGDIQTIHVRPFRIGVFRNRKGLRRALRWLSLLCSPRLMTYWHLERARFRPQPGRQIVATSDQVLNDIHQAYPDCIAFTQVITPGVRLPEKRIDTALARVQLGLPTNAPVALFVGNDFAKKGLGPLLSSLPLIPELHLAVVGEGLEVEQFEQQSEQLKIAQRVHFLGPLTDVGIAYDASDMLVHPTTEDTYAMVVLEAMAHGLPVIVSRAPYCGIAAELEHKHDVLILDDPFDLNLIATSIEILQKNSLLRNKVQSGGFQFAKDRNWEDISIQYEYLYEKTIQSIHNIA